MQYLINAYDGENMLEKRMEVRPRHLENINKLLASMWYLPEAG